MNKLASYAIAAGLALIGGTMAISPSPAWAGDDCSYSYVENWEVIYDRTCNREINRKIAGLNLSFAFPGTASAPSALKLSVSPKPASIVVDIGKRRIATATATPELQLTGPALQAVFSALRQQRAVTVTVTRSSGIANPYVVDGNGFEAAYQRMIE